MDIYLPIAGQSVNALFIVVLGFLVGLLSGMFGVGGGFLTTPLLIFYGIPPTVAVASATTQITGASVSGAMVHMRRGGVDLKMAGVMIAGGLLGSLIGAAVFRLLQSSGQIDVVIGFMYVLILGWIGSIMVVDSLKSLGYIRPAVPEGPRPRHNRWVASLPYRWRFHASGLYISPVAPFALGLLAGLLLGGGVVGAQYGALLTLRIKPDFLRLALAIIILLVALRMALGLAWRPDEIFSIEYL